MGKARLRCAGDVGELVAQSTVDNDDAAIDRGGRRSGALARLEPHIVLQDRYQCVLGDGIRVMYAGPPANEMQQIHSVAAQCGLRQTADVFTIQKTIDPIHFTASARLDDMKGTSCPTV